MIRGFFLRRRAARQLERYERGFGWAATELLLKNTTIDEVESHVLDTGYSNDFDRGARNAIVVIERLRGD